MGAPGITIFTNRQLAAVEGRDRAKGEWISSMAYAGMQQNLRPETDNNDHSDDEDERIQVHADETQPIAPKGTKSIKKHLQEINQKVKEDQDELKPLLGWMYGLPTQVQCLLVVGFFLGMGTVVFYLLEDHYSALDALYFSVVTLTTVGYGDLTPRSDGGRVFTIFYGFAGVMLISAWLGALVDQMFERQQDLVEAALTDVPSEKAAAVPTGGLYHQLFTNKRLWTAIATLLFFLAIGTLFYCFDNEGSDRFIDAFYIACTTSTTVGYGDLHPEGNVQKWFTIFWMILVIFSMANVVGVATELRVKIKSDEMQNSLLYTQFDKDKFGQADADQDGRVSRFEYLVSMLIKMDKVESEEIEEIMERFDHLDRGASQLPDGFITTDDLANLETSGLAGMSSRD